MSVLKPACSLLLCLSLTCGGCAVVTVADTALSVAATTVRVGVNVAGAVVDATAAGIRTVSQSTAPNHGSTRL